MSSITSLHDRRQASSPVQNVLDRLKGVRQDGAGWKALCPAHDDRRPSLKLDVAPDGKVLVHCFAGCRTEDVVRALGLEMADLMPDRPHPGKRNGRPGGHGAIYVYRDREGKPLFRVVRKPGKRFYQQRPDGRGRWISGIKGVTRVLYRLPEVLAAAQAGRRVYIVEGEKDADNLAQLDLVATTNPGGAGKWRREYSETLRGTHVVILPDNDEQGHKHAQQVARALHGVAASVKVLELPGLEPKGDVSDWLQAGGSREELDRLADEAPEWTPPADDDEEPAGEPPAGARVLAPPGEPLSNARRFVEDHFTRDDIRTIHHQQDAWWVWDGTCYRETETATLRSMLYGWLEGAYWFDDEGRPRPWQPNRGHVENILDAVRAVAHLPKDVQAPAWLGEPGPHPAHELISCRNGLLHVPTRTLLPHDPRLFATWALPFDYDPNAPAPAQWLTFLQQLWEDDQEAIDTLQEWFGYTLTPDTSLQKALLIVGPPRAGKGNIARVQRHLVGPENVAGPTLSSFSQNFGLAPLVGKPFAIISDARLSGRADQQAVVERLLSITGEDSLTIDRKFREAWTGQLPTRIMILTNELPRLGDSSGALANRFIVLRLTKSFAGQEDPGLTARLLTELPGILNWALDGLDRLRERGYFVQPSSGADVARELVELSSPITAFLRECCVTGPGRMVTVDDLYSEWREWCQANGRDHPGTKWTFGRDLAAAVPHVTVSQRRMSGKVVRVYEGIGLVSRDVTRDNLLHARGPTIPTKSTSQSIEHNSASRVTSRDTPAVPSRGGEDRPRSDANSAAFSTEREVFEL